MAAPPEPTSADYDRSASKEALIANFHEWREFYPRSDPALVTDLTKLRIIQRRLCRPLPICRYRNAR